LRWEPVQGASGYRVEIRTAADAKAPVLDKAVSENRYIFNKDRVYTGNIYYRVLAVMSDGFMMRSKLQPFTFVFLAPAPVIPLDGSIIGPPKLKAEGDSVLFTWQKTNFTEAYELEVARDPQFKNLVQKLKLPENFYANEHPEAGVYYWRVKSLARNLWSSFSKVSKVTVRR
jgi:hypothetical protein